MFITLMVVNMLINKEFILASNSLSRYKLLKNAGLEFTKKKPLCNEELIKKQLVKKKINKKKHSNFFSQRKSSKC